MPATDARRTARRVARRARRRARRRVARADLHRRRGRVCDLIGLVVEATGLEAEVGEVCDVAAGRGRAPVPAEVVGFRAGRTLLMPLGEMTGIGPGNVVTPTGRPVRVPRRRRPARPRPRRARPPARRRARSSSRWPTAPAEGPPPDALSRPRIRDRMPLGVRALDTLVPCGRGQRLGIFAGSGVGKSSLLGMIARSAATDVNVICLVGERGREVLEFIERDLGDALSRSVVVVATSDQPALVRIKAALTATAIAEHFRDRGDDVLLMMDSVTRFAMAQREVGLAVGEPPATRGYTPSVFALLPRLLERSGTSDRGSITGLYTVLVDGDDMNEPVADAVALDPRRPRRPDARARARRPLPGDRRAAVRLAPAAEIVDARRPGREPASCAGCSPRYRDKRDLIAIGAYERGSDPVADRAIDLHDRDRRVPPPARRRADRGRARPTRGCSSCVGGGPGADRSPSAEPVEEPVAARRRPTPALSAIPPLHLGIR